MIRGCGGPSMQVVVTNGMRRFESSDNLCGGAGLGLVVHQRPGAIGESTVVVARQGVYQPGANRAPSLGALHGLHNVQIARRRCPFLPG